MAKAKAKVWLVSFELHDYGDDIGEFLTKKDVIDNVELASGDPDCAKVKKLKVTEVK